MAADTCNCRCNPDSPAGFTNMSEHFGPMRQRHGSFVEFVSVALLLASAIAFSFDQAANSS
eukprot:m.41929 g.41929  ORF g.41929 m.41929 type:complete len:61 (+) comp12844_c0_seq54:135-317(+)